jgi:hypothetical protein
MRCNSHVELAPPPQATCLHLFAFDLRSLQGSWKERWANYRDFLFTIANLPEAGSFPLNHGFWH